ncbi:geranylgeranylglyceryl/heptaprenylglyceryl phosphate synthase [Paenibacillus sp. FSL A5-0031]|uniref:heptaprenylglyceryl phosphate synthase n=1 Tax=Paenibacillus sp. FSL A5-0031 TaxID=1920420 RepID=UPI00096D4CE9|nr:heptaprenylglyceryl phosphate synthase [Paenibacillus sp. FSL A5-0031]OME87090.1 geranylgeranylglyceryl/heptaprenylglyceryl phosphate synthase [Paenibacillus sp. FSL A5-0031]
MNEVWFSSWRHVFKLDPDREISDEQLDAICTSGTDAIIVGGSSGVTFENTVDLMARIRRYAVDCALEVSTLEGAVPGFDGYFVPLVLNTSRAEWITGRQTEGLIEYGSFVPWEETAAQGYIILNEEATAAKVTGAQTELTEAELTAHVRMADRLMRLPVVYLEYSGRFGDMQLVKRARMTATQARVFYGGGIDNADKARQAAEAAHTVVVGNIIYSDLEAALSTVAAVKIV